jgi:hypothetical protein
MMKKHDDSHYGGISSFEDFRLESEMLKMRSKFIEAKLKLTYLQIRRVFSVSNLLSSVARDVVLPKISDFLNSLIGKAQNKTD